MKMITKRKMKTQRRNLQKEISQKVLNFEHKLYMTIIY